MSKTLNTDAWGRPKTITDYSILSGLFTFNIPDTIWKAGINTGGNIVWENKVSDDSSYVSSVNGALSLKSSAIGNSKVLQSKRHPRYQANRGHLYSSSMKVTGIGNGSVKFGVSTQYNGVYFEVDEAGVLYAVRKTLGVVVQREKCNISLVNKNIDDFDLSKGNVYDIQFQWRGVGNYYFYVNQVKVLTFTTLGILDDLSIANPALSALFEVESTTGNEIELKCGCIDITSEGGNAQKQELVPLISKSYAATNNVIYAVKVNELFNGLYNTRDVMPHRGLIDVSKKCVLNCYITRNENLMSNPTFVNTVEGNLGIFDPVDSGASTFNEGDSTKLFSIPCLAGVPNGIKFASAEETELFITNGDILIFTITGSSVTTELSLELGQET